MAFSIDDAWNTVALEERLDLLSRAHAHGIMAGLASFFLLGSIAYGFDQIYILLGGFLAAFFLVPMFTSYSWRRGKPALILAYLAARTVSRRYAYGHNLSDLDIVLIYRGVMREIFANREDEELTRQRQSVDFDSAGADDDKPVWICLLRGAVVILSERTGGAKLEFIAPVTNELGIDKADRNEGFSDNAIMLEGVQMSKGRKIILDSPSSGAQYVFGRQLQRLVGEYRPPVTMYNGGRDE